MADKEDDDSFLQEFLARAQKRQAKLAQIGDSDSISDRDEVSYPPLSPLAEEDNETSGSLQEERRKVDSHTDTKDENSSPSIPELNYSSDLSLDCDTDEVYRAEPILCQSSPETNQPQSISHYPVQVSPRKQAPSASNHPNDRTVPLQERQSDQKATSSQSLPSASTSEQTLQDLQLKVDRAEQTRTQLKKVVEISKHGSKEHIEAARLMQIAELEHLNLTNYAAMFKQGIRRRTESLGSIQITGLRLKISSKLRNDLADDSVSHYFFCIASCGTEVKATEIIDTNDIRRQDLKAHLQFKERISFIDLPPDFVVKVEVFELVVGQHLPKLLSRLTPSKKTKITPESYFKRVGSLKLTLADRDTCYKNLVQWSKLEESKYIERECKFHMELKPEQLPCKAGMLHVRCLDSEGRPDWSRFWVDLSSGLIRYWKSKQDALDQKKPNQVLSFTDLCSERVQKLTPDDDLYRQNSFVLYSIQQVTGGESENLFQRMFKEDPKLKLVKHQLAADNKEDRDAWCSVLDRSMQCFREWHGKCKVFSIDEIKEIFLTSH